MGVAVGVGRGVAVGVGTGVGGAPHATINIERKASRRAKNFILNVRRQMYRDCTISIADC